MNATAPAAATAPETLKGKPGTHQCPQCTYSAMTAGSLQGHVAMAHEAGVPVQVEITPRGRRMIERQAEAIADVVDRGPFLVEVPLELVDIGENVRVDPGELAELAASITELGVLQPIRVIGPSHEGRYRAVWGQRRVMASIIAKKATIPALVELEAEANVPGARRSIEQLVENLQRLDLSPIEEAVAMRAVLDAEKGLTQEALAAKLGRSGAWVSNTLGLLKAPKVIQDAVRSGQLSIAHAKALSGLPDKVAADMARDAIANGQTSHDLERNAKWKREDLARRERDRVKIEKIGRSAVASLEKVATKDQQIAIADEIVAGVIRAAGWTNILEARRYDVDVVKNAAECGCTAWLVDFDPYGSKTEAKVAPCCTDPVHRQARLDARRAEADRLSTERDAAEEARKATAEADRAAIAGGLRPVIEGLTPSFRRALLFIVAAGSHSLMTALQGRHGGSTTSHTPADDWPTITALTDAEVLDELGIAVAMQACPNERWYAEKADPLRLALLAEVGQTAVPAKRSGKKAARS